MIHSKHPRTLHLPWSPGATDDDVVMTSTEAFEGQEVVVTEKMDGECTSMYRNGIHARSLDGRDHPSRSYVKGIQAKIGHDLFDNQRLVGENCYAVHSIPYESLPDWFLLFGAFFDSLIDEGQVFCSSWDFVTGTASRYGLPTVPVLYRGPWDENAVRACYTGASRCGGEQEGYVVRLARAFNMSEWPRAVGKSVRAGHAQTDEHWMHGKVRVNGRRPQRGVT